MKKTLLSGGMLFAGFPDCGLQRGDVLIEGSLIASIESVISPAPDVEDIHDVRGCTVLPGLINLHEHLTMKRTYGPPGPQLKLDDGYLLIRGIRAALRDIREGVTTVREVGSKSQLNIILKRAIEQRAIPGPRVLAAQFLSTTGGHAADFGYTTDGSIGFRKSVRQAITSGADWIKVIASNDPIRQGLQDQHAHPEISEKELRTCVEEAHRWCKKVSVHAMGNRTLEEVIRCHPDTIEHGIYLDAKLAREMEQLGIALVPTLNGYRQTMLPQTGRGEDWAARHQLLVEPHRKSFLAALEANVTMGIGTDTAGDYVEELEMMVELGMPQGLALSCATHNGAFILGLEGEIGTIEPGKIADLLVIKGDPLTDLLSLRKVELVVQNGEVWRPPEIEICTEDETEYWNTLGLLQSGKLC